MPDETQYRGLNVVVTGADGFIGSHLTEALVHRGASVTALCQYNSFGSQGWLDDLSDEARNALTITAGDIRDPHFVSNLVDGADIVFHLAALIAIPYSYVSVQSYVDTNVTGTVNVLEACRRCQVGRMVHTSTSEVYGTAQYTPIDEDHPLQAQSPYSASKIGADSMVDAYARSFNTHAVILRPFNTYGPRQSERAVIPTTIRQVLQPDLAEIRLGDLSPVRDFNYVGDTVDAFLAVGTADGLDWGKVYNAGSGTGITIGEMVERVQKIIGGPEKPVVTEQHRMRPADSEVMALIAQAEKFTAATGWKPRETIDSGLEKTIDWWRDVIDAGRQRRGSDYLV